MRRLALTLFTLTLTLSLAAAAQAQLRIEVTIPSSVPLNGHLILAIAKVDASAPARGGRDAAAREPRFMLSETYTSAQGFGVDASNLAPGKPLVIDARTIGYPLPNLATVPAGDYLVQGVFNKYEEFHLADGRDLWLPPDHGEGQHWNRKPGNPYNEPVLIHIDPASNTPIKLTLDKIIPPITGTDEDPEVIAKRDPEAAKYLKYIKFRSDKLSKFWGRDVYLGAWILLPSGFDEHPDAHYPLVVYQDHFHPVPIPFNSKPSAAGRNRRGGGGVDRGYVLYQDWTNGTLPHVILLYVQNANPYYDDSYDVDSANVGPYGAAINDELIPQIEKQYRGIGQGWARATYGGSTGGWESLATQIFYPDMYNGVWSACPDPVDFHAYQNINLYDDANAFYRHGDFGEVPVGGDRKPDGSLIATAESEFRFEYILGTHTRSTEQWAIWQAVFSPVGPDGYPADVLDSLTGKINPAVVAYWHDHYDLNAYMQRNWPTLGPKLEGKIHIAVGDGDTYFLNNAVHLLQKSLDATRNPHSDAQFQYGPGQPHCYTGGPVEYTMRQNNADWLQRILPQMTAHMIATAPKGADTTSWVY
ncbi:MAG: esterase [Acidobacteriaceae bacterium]